MVSYLRIETAALCTMEDGVQAISATIDRKVKVLVSEASIRRHLKLEDSEGLSSLPNAEIFEQLVNGLNNCDFTSICLTINPPLHTLYQHLIDTTHHTEEPTQMPHESPLHSVHSLGRDEGSLSLNELTLILKVKKLEKQVQTTISRRKTKIVLSEDEGAAEDFSNQRRIIEEIDADTDITLVTPTKFRSQSDQSEDHLRVLSAAKVLEEDAKQGRSVGLTQTYTRRRRNVGTGSGEVSTAVN
ncbi:hypothetical protein Tco_0002271 [Tanacetum coccineum]